MASGVALRESVKEMKRLKNEPLLMLAIIAIILFVGFFVVYPVIRVITFPSGQDYMQLFQKARWFTALKNSLFMTLISTVSCTAVAFLFAYVIARLDFRILAGGCGWPVRPSDRRTKIRVGFQNRPVFFTAF